MLFWPFDERGVIERGEMMSGMPRWERVDREGQWWSTSEGWGQPGWGRRKELQTHQGAKKKREGKDGTLRSRALRIIF